MTSLSFDTPEMDALVDAVANDHTVALVGAGCSVRVRYPTWETLLDDMHGEVLRAQEEHHPPRHHHRQRARGIDDPGSGRLAAVEPVDIERAEVRLDELEELAGEADFRRLVRA